MHVCQRLAPALASHGPGRDAILGVNFMSRGAGMGAVHIFSFPPDRRMPGLNNVGWARLCCIFSYNSQGASLYLIPFHDSTNIFHLQYSAHTSFSYGVIIFETFSSQHWHVFGVQIASRWKNQDDHLIYKLFAGLIQYWYLPGAQVSIQNPFNWNLAQPQ